MLKSRCRETRKRMHSYLDGDLSPTDEEAMRAHVAQCGDCAPAFERLRRSDDAVRSHFEATVAHATAPGGILEWFVESATARRRGALDGVRRISSQRFPVGCLRRRRWPRC